MKHKYEFGVLLPLAKAVSAVAELEESINDSMASAGYEEKLRITTLHTGVVTVDREMTDAEIETMKKLMIETFAESKFGTVTFEYFRHKPGNVEQLVA